MRQTKKIGSILLATLLCMPNTSLVFANTSNMTNSTRSIISKTVDIPVSVKWKDYENQDGKRPQKVKATLVQDGKETEHSVVLEDKNTWRGSFNGFPIYNQEHKKIHYSIKQEEVTDYTSEVIGEINGEFTEYEVVDARIEVHLYDEKGQIVDNQFTRGNVTAKVNIVLLDQDGNEVETNSCVGQVKIQGKDGYVVEEIETNPDGTYEKAYSISSEMKVTVNYQLPNGDVKIGEVSCEELVDKTPPIISGVTATPTEDGKFIIEGNAEPDIIVIITKPDGSKEEVTSDSNGDFKFELDGVKDGDKFELVATDKAGNVSNLVDLVASIPSTEEPEEPLWAVFDNLIIAEINGDETESDGLSKCSSNSLIIKGRLENFTGKAGNYIFNITSNIISYDTNTTTVIAAVDQKGNFVFTLETILIENDQGAIRVEFDGKTDTVRVEYSDYESILTYSDRNSYSIENRSRLQARSQSSEKEEGFVITYSHIPEKISIDGQILWEDCENQDGKRPANITVDLYKNGKFIASQTVSGTALNVWQYSFPKQDKYQNEKEAVYSVVCHQVDGYQSEIVGTDITNRYTPGKITIPVVTYWDDCEDQDGKRPSAVTVRLYADGEVKQVTELKEDNTWAGNFKDLDEYKNGKKIEYTVVQDEIVNYHTTISGSAISGYQITNKYTPETLEVRGSLVWEDALNQAGKRPTQVEVIVYADGIEVVKETITGSTEQWDFVFGKLPKYKNGKEITYTISQTNISNYTATILDKGEGNFLIKNQYIAVDGNDKKEEPVVSEDKKEEPAVSEDKKEEPAVSEDKKEEPVVSEDKKEEPVVSEDKKEEPVVSEDKKEEPITSEDGDRVYTSNSNGNASLDIANPKPQDNHNNTSSENKKKENMYYAQSAGGDRLQLTWNGYKEWVKETGNKGISFIEYKKYVLAAGNKGISFAEYKKGLEKQNNGIVSGLGNEVLSNLPKTGDDTSIVILSVIMLSSMLVIIENIRKVRRK